MSAIKKPLTLSIIIPAYNEERHLVACLESITAQTVRPDEVIVVDNNSTDKTRNIAKRYSFVRVISEKRQGVVFARDAGFDAAYCDLIGRIDADTILPPTWVEYVKYFYTHKPLEALTGGAYFYNVRMPRLLGWFQGHIAFQLNRLMMGHYILFGSNMVLPKKIWNRARKDVCHDTAVHEDLDLGIHVNKLGYKIIYDKKLEVGVKMRRVVSDRDELWNNLKWWPNTLRRHGNRYWTIAYMGAAIIWTISPLMTLFEQLSRLLRRPPLND